MIDRDRKFEKWAESEDFNTTLHPHAIEGAEYEDDLTQMAYDGWRACKSLYGIDQPN